MCALLCRCDIRPTHASYPLVRSHLTCVKDPSKWRADAGVKSRCEPGSLVAVLEVVSAQLGVDLIELADIVWANTLRVFFPREEAAEAQGAPAAQQQEQQQ